MENLMQKYTSKPYNPNIAYVFSLAGFLRVGGVVLKICSVVTSSPAYRGAGFLSHSANSRFSFDSTNVLS